MKEYYVITKPFQAIKHFLKMTDGADKWVLQAADATHFLTFEDSLKYKDAHYPDDASCDIEVYQG